jgi:hypothetical protein
VVVIDDLDEAVFMTPEQTLIGKNKSSKWRLNVDNMPVTYIEECRKIGL